MSKIMVHNTHGKDDVERATLAFVVGNTALTSGQEAILLLTIDGVWLGTQGYTDGLQADGFAPLKELIENFAKNGGEIWVCGVDRRRADGGRSHSRGSPSQWCSDDEFLGGCGNFTG